VYLQIKGQNILDIGQYLHAQLDGMVRSNSNYLFWEDADDYHKRIMMYANGDGVIVQINPGVVEDAKTFNVLARLILFNS